MARTLSIIGAPSSAGAYAPGQEKAPSTFRHHGLVSQLERSGLDVVDRGDVGGFRWRSDPSNSKAMNLETAHNVAKELAAVVTTALDDEHNLLILGGDCTIELGVVAGALTHYASLGLIYIDVDADLNPPVASDGALEWTGVAHLLDLPGAANELAGLAPRRPMLSAADILFFAVANVTDGEAETIRVRNLSMIGLQEVKSNPIEAARRATQWARSFDTILVHLDIDVLDFADFPLAENTRRGLGLTLEELSAALFELRALPDRRVLTVTEVNPDHAPDEAESFRRLIGLLSQALAE
ncbi:arginase family protein [Ensifer aridi]|uniref:arginase family protein n=1 Tax=Ensifer aridi TaxID=1708715 RepID=UPI000A113E99|nr:arginase family protein [Ensifer aridi]